MAKFRTHCGKEFFTSKELVMIELINKIARHGHTGSIWASCVETQDGKVYYSLESGNKPTNIKSLSWAGGFDISWQKVNWRTQIFDQSTATMITEKDGSFFTKGF